MNRPKAPGAPQATTPKSQMVASLPRVLIVVLMHKARRFDACSHGQGQVLRGPNLVLAHNYQPGYDSKCHLRRREPDPVDLLIEQRVHEPQYLVEQARPQE